MSTHSGDQEESKDLTATEHDHDEGSDYNALIEHYKKIIEYKSNIIKTDALLAIEKDEAIQEELTKVRASLIQAISYEEDIIKFTQNSDEYYFSPDILDHTVIDRLCRVYIQSENKWFHAKIESVDMETQEAEVTLIGPNDRIKVHSCFVKLLPMPDPMSFQVGTHCEAIYSGDGRYYPCVIEKIVDGQYHIKFRRYNNKEVVSLYHLREVENDEDMNPNVGDMKEFKIPEHLKILPNDSEAERKKKKKKIKALKQAFKNQQLEKVVEEKKNAWGAFTQKAAMKKNSLFKNKESIFRTPEGIQSKVGVTGSGKGMTQYSQMGKYVFNAEDKNQ